MLLNFPSKSGVQVRAETAPGEGLARALRRDRDNGATHFPTAIQKHRRAFPPEAVLQARFGKVGTETHRALKSAPALFHFRQWWQSRQESACPLFFKTVLRPSLMTSFLRKHPCAPTFSQEKEKFMQNTTLHPI